MWSIGDVKRKGWCNLKNYYWAAFVVSIIAGILGGNSGAIGGNLGRIGNRGSHSGVDYSSVSGSSLDSAYTSGSGLVSSSAGIMIASIFIFLMIGIMLAIAVFHIFVGNPVTVGSCRFYMESRALKKSAGVGRVFWVFKSGSYWNVVKIMFLRDLYTFLWGLLLVIPGIIKGYSYIQIPYILSENPDADSRDVFALTKDMMQGYKFQYFLFGLSFIGWLILCAFTCGIGLLFLTPYMEASGAEIYACCRRNIDGFPFAGYGFAEEESVEEGTYEPSGSPEDPIDI